MKKNNLLFSFIILAFIFAETNSTLTESINQFYNLSKFDENTLVNEILALDL